MAERRQHPNGGIYERGPDGQWHLVGGANPLTGADPMVGPQTQKAQNEAAASVYDPAQSAANVRQTEANTRRIEAITPAQIRQANANAAKAEREATAGAWGDVDKEFAKEFVSWRAAGGYADVRKQLEQLAEARRALEAGSKNLTGPIVGRVPDFIGAFTNPSAISTRESVEEVVQRALRLILGAQFTEKEGERLIARAYNPALEEAENAKRVGRLITQLGSMADAKEAAADYFQKHGTLRGYEGPSFLASSLVDFNLDEDSPGAVIGPDGMVDYSGMQGGGKKAAVAPGTSYRTEPDAQANALIDRLVRSGVPYSKALRQFRDAYPDATLFAPKDYNDALQHFRQNPGFRGTYGGAVRSVPLSEREQSNNAASQSGIGAFAGHLADASLAGIPSALAGDQGQFWRATTQHQNPVPSVAGDIVGGVTGTLGINKLLGPVSRYAGPLLSTPGRRAFAADTLYGGAFGATQNPDDPLGGALTGAGAMAAGNVAGRYTIGPALSWLGGTRPGRAVTGMFGGGAPPSVSKGQQMIVGQADNIDPILGRLNEAADLGLPYSLADADPRLRALAGSAVRKSPDVLKLAEDTLTPRHLGQAERALGFIDDRLAPTGDVPTMVADARKRAQAASKPYYEKAMARPVPEDAALDDMLRTPAGEAAAREAYQIALNEGASPAELSFTLGVDGAPIINANPNWRTLHYIRQGFDSVLEKSRDGLSGTLNMKDPATRALNDLRSRFSVRIHELNPDFRAADKTYAEIIEQGTAAERGARATAPRVTPEQAQAALLASRSPDNFRRGYASSLADTVENSRLAGDPYERIYGSTAQQRKLGAIFPEGAETFGRIRGLETDMSKTYREALGGSQTQPRAEADKLFDSGGNMAEIGVALATGTPPVNALSRTLGPGIKDWWRLGHGRKRADEIGPLLLNSNPAEAAAILKELADLAAARKAYEAQARAMGGMFGAPLTLPFTQ